MISLNIDRLLLSARTAKWQSLFTRISALEWKRMLFRVRAFGWKRPLFLLIFIPAMFHIFQTVTLPNYSDIQLDPAPQKQSNEPIEDRQGIELGNLKNMPGFDMLGLDPEELYIRSGEKEMIMNPLIKYLLEYSPGDLEYAVIRGIIKMEAHDASVLNAYAFAAVLILLLMAVLTQSGHSWLILPFAKAGLNIGWLMIFTTVLLSPLLWFIFDYNLLGRMNGIFMKGPLYLFVSSVISLKMYDVHSPVFNRLIAPFTSLTISAAVIYLF